MKRVWMKSIFLAAAVGACLSWGLSSCQLETSGNGRLDGYWQLTTIDTLETGGSTDVRGERIMWAVQGRLMQLRNSHDNLFGIYFSFSHRGDSLLMKNPYVSKRELDDLKITDAEMLEDYGAHNLEEHFFVEHLDGSRMRLRDGVFRLSFRKY